jgi:hypothetical protein
MSAELDNARAYDEALIRLQAERPDLARFMRLPPKERPRLVRARMAELIVNRFSAAGQVTLDDLHAAGFTDAEIAEHFTAARRCARVERMVA